mmetsp:Transcript_54704/g.90735  ORF Transcript_54704/g.90735 Transcript_54704/m.90735 type:complete len:212 (+) Transcript_54704:270-905(+)
MNGDAIHLRVVHKPNGLLRKQLAIIGRRQVRFRRLRRIQLQSFANTFAQHIQRWIRLHNLTHGALQKWLDARKPMSIPAVHIIRQINAEQDTRRRRIQRHLIRGIVEKLGATISFNIMRVIVAPTQLNIEPIFCRGRTTIIRFMRFTQQRRRTHLPFIRRKQQDIRTRTVHLVRFTRMNRLFLHRLNLERIQLAIKHLAHIHHQRLVDLLP